MPVCRFFFFNDTATTEIYTLSLHDALPISRVRGSRPTCAWLPPRRWTRARGRATRARTAGPWPPRDRKSTRLNSSHLVISYAVFCLKKKQERNYRAPQTQMIFLSAFHVFQL